MYQHRCGTWLCVNMHGWAISSRHVLYLADVERAAGVPVPDPLLQGSPVSRDGWHWKITGRVTLPMGLSGG